MLNPSMKMWKREREMDDVSFDTNFNTKKTEFSFPDANQSKKTK